MGNKKSPATRSVGRPRTKIKWEGMGVRFEANDKKRLETVALQLGMTQQEVVRRGTLALITQVEATGKFELVVTR